MAQAPANYTAEIPSDLLAAVTDPVERLLLTGQARAGLASKDDQQWRHAMRENLRPGELFPDIDLPNQDEEPTKLSSLMAGFPMVLVFSRGYY
jgi:hypothetical protein